MSDMSDLLPYPTNNGQTPYEGCWDQQGHHNCAVVKLREAEAQRDAVREALTRVVKRDAPNRRVVAIDYWEHAHHALAATAAAAATRDERLRRTERKRCAEAIVPIGVEWDGKEPADFVVQRCYDAILEL